MIMHTPMISRPKMRIYVSYFDDSISLQSSPNWAIPKTMTKVMGMRTIKAAKKLVHPIMRPNVSNLIQHRKLFTRHILALQNFSRN